jgi:hypothetical protein
MYKRQYNLNCAIDLVRKYLSVHDGTEQINFSFFFLSSLFSSRLLGRQWQRHHRFCTQTAVVYKSCKQNARLRQWPDPGLAVILSSTTVQ